MGFKSLGNDPEFQILILPVFHAWSCWFIFSPHFGVCLFHHSRPPRTKSHNNKSIFPSNFGCDGGVQQQVSVQPTQPHQQFTVERTRRLGRFVHRLADGLLRPGQRNLPAAFALVRFIIGRQQCHSSAH